MESWLYTVFYSDMEPIIQIENVVSDTSGYTFSQRGGKTVGLSISCESLIWLFQQF